VLASTAGPGAVPVLADVPTPPPIVQEAVKQTQSLSFPSSNAPAVKSESGLPEDNTWRYSEFIGAVQGGKVERVRFSKDGSQLQLTAIDGRRASVTLPNDPELVELLARNGVDISVSEGEQQGNFVSLLGNLLFPLFAFAGLFFLFRRANDGSGSNSGGGMGGMGAFPVHSPPSHLLVCVSVYPRATTQLTAKGMPQCIFGLPSQQTDQEWELLECLRSDLYRPCLYVPRQEQSFRDAA
jgi:hypothetical protein